MASALNVYNVVADFGADPTGASDSSSAFQNAINAAQAAPSAAVYVPGGIYVADGLVQSSQFAGIIGAGRAATLIRTSSPSATLLKIQNTFLAKVAGLTLCGKGNAIQIGGALIEAKNAHACDFSDLELVDGYNGIVLDNATNCRMSFCKAFQFYGPSFVSVLNGGAAHIESNQFDTSSYGPTPYSYGAPVTLWSPLTRFAAGAVAIANNAYFIAGNAGMSGSIPPAIAPFGTAVPDGGVNWYFLCSTAFRPVTLGPGANSNFVRFNDIDGPNAGAIRIDGSSTNIVIGNTLSNGLRSGIDIFAGSNDNKIALNMFQNFPLRGIEERSGSIIGSVIVHNTIANITYDEIKTMGAGGIYTPNVLH